MPFLGDRLIFLFSKTINSFSTTFSYSVHERKRQTVALNAIISALVKWLFSQSLDVKNKILYKCQVEIQTIDAISTETNYILLKAAISVYRDECILSSHLKQGGTHFVNQLRYIF